MVRIDAHQRAGGTFSPVCRRRPLLLPAFICDTSPVVYPQQESRYGLV